MEVDGDPRGVPGRLRDDIVMADDVFLKITLGLLRETTLDILRDRLGVLDCGRRSAEDRERE